MPPSRHHRETIRFEKSSSHPQNVQTAYYTRLKPQLWQSCLPLPLKLVSAGFVYPKKALE
ncbi:hypothetical protein NEIFLAOT_00541 [Neisseria flavescens NRL30031/H210]|uniref:Uncharacterized protein n=1 Tax=Neisseria flavescens NRL30031/H210 TaxID=546264 RepID=C0EKT8_NEIFL|nr:hypothetical protein NEIFLAOT_00541 [Neisseria flavescens NRL30031/H210]